MKFSAQSLNSDKLSDLVSRQRITGEKLECIIYSYKAGAEFAVHEHEAEQITLVLTGELIFTFADERVHLKAHEAILIPSYKAHGAFVPEGCPETTTYNMFSPVREQLPTA